MQTNHRKISLAIGLTAVVACIALVYTQIGQWYGISAYRPSDQVALTKILRDDWYLLVSEGATTFTPEYMFEHRAATPAEADNSLHIFVYRVHGKPAGFVTFYREAGCKGRVQFLAVGKDYRRLGYARKLLEFAVRELGKQGVCSVGLAVRATNATAYKLYTSLGFKKIWEEAGFLGLEKSLL